MSINEEEEPNQKLPSTQILTKSIITFLQKKFDLK